MTMQIINVGSAEQAGDGESVRNAFIKINENFTEVYAQQGISDRLVNGSKTVSLGSDGNLTLPAGGTILNSSGEPYVNGVSSINTSVSTSIFTDASGDYQYGTLSYDYAVNGVSNSFSIEYSRPLVGGNVDINVGNTIVNGDLTLSGDIKSNGNINIDINLADSTLRRWQFGEDGILTLPAGGDIVDSTGASVLHSGAELVGEGVAQVGSSLVIATDSGGGLTGWSSTAASIAYDANILSTYAVGSTITWQDGTTATLTQVDSYAPSSLDIFWNTPKTGTLFPITLKTANYVAATPARSSITVTGKQWTFNENGSLTYPNTALQRDTSTVSCAGNASTVVYTVSAQYQHTIKLLIQVEGFEGVNTVFDTQACEMIIAKSFRANALAASVYGVVHTSVSPLATFTANWNALTSRVEVICTAPSANTVNVRTFATEITTSD